MLVASATSTPFFASAHGLPSASFAAATLSVLSRAHSRNRAPAVFFLSSRKGKDNLFNTLRYRRSPLYLTLLFLWITPRASETPFDRGIRRREVEGFRESPD
jgi:hypothetical protein